MTNKPKAIGTFAESSVVPVLKPYFPDAERLSLKGTEDEGDIGHCGDFIFEVKGGKQTEQVGPTKLAAWFFETYAEAANRGVAYGILVLQRKGYGRPRAHHWWAYISISNFCAITGSGYRNPGYMRLELGQLLEILADNGATVDVLDAA